MKDFIKELIEELPALALGILGGLFFAFIIYVRLTCYMSGVYYN